MNVVSLESKKQSINLILKSSMVTALEFIQIAQGEFDYSRNDYLRNVYHGCLENICLNDLLNLEKNTNIFNSIEDSSRNQRYSINKTKKLEWLKKELNLEYQELSSRIFQYYINEFIKFYNLEMKNSLYFRNFKEILGKLSSLNSPLFENGIEPKFVLETLKDQNNMRIISFEPKSIFLTSKTPIYSF